MLNPRTAVLVACLAWLAPQAAPAASLPQPGSLSPTALAATPDGKRLFIACATANEVAVFDLASGAVTRRISVPRITLRLSGLARRRSPLRHLCRAEEQRPRARHRFRQDAGHASAPATLRPPPSLSPDGKTLFVCNRFNNDISVINLDTRKELCRIPVQREPTAADITRDGRFLLVANHLHTGSADAERVAAVVSVIDTATRKVVKELALPDGSGLLNDLRVSPDGKYAVVTPHSAPLPPAGDPA